MLPTNVSNTDVAKRFHIFLCEFLKLSKRLVCQRNPSQFAVAQIYTFLHFFKYILQILKQRQMHSYALKVVTFRLA